VQCIMNNLKKFEMLDHAQVLQGDVLVKMGALEKQGRSFDIIYVDPPYELKEEGLHYAELVLRSVDEGSLLKSDGSLFIEGAARAELHVEALTTLTLRSSRERGRSTLQQYVKNQS